MLRFLRMRVLPWLVWLGAASSAAWLWYDQRTGSALGYVEGVSYGITAIEPGRIATVTVQPGQRVQAGEEAVAWLGVGEGINPAINVSECGE